MLKHIVFGIVLLAGLLGGLAWADDALNKALIDAAMLGHRAEIEALISKGADVNAKDNNGYTPLYWAVIGGEKQVAELLISKGADVNAKANGDFTPLHWANKKELAELLISKGADVNAKAYNGYTPLHTAAEKGRKEVASLLISKGVDVNAKANDSDTPLHMAAYSFDDTKYVAVAELLIAKGAGVNAKGNYGDAPLHRAIRRHNKIMIELLIVNDAALDTKNDQGNTPIQQTGDINDAKAKQEIIALLQGQMAKQSNPRQMQNSLLEQFKGHSDNDELRKSIIAAASKVQPPPAVPQEAEDAAGRAAYIFKTAKSDDDFLSTAKEYLKAVEVAPWVANYYYNLCTVLEKTPYTPQALHACKLYLEAAPNAADAADIRQSIAGLKYAVDKNKEQMKQRTAYIGRQGREELYRIGGIPGQVAGKDAALKLAVDWKASPPKYQIMTACIEGDSAYTEVHDLVSTNRWFSLCPNTNLHIVIKPEGQGYVELSDGSVGSIRSTLEELFQHKQKMLQQSLIFKDYGYGTDKGMRFYVAFQHGGRDTKYAGYAMYESDCNGNLLRQDPRALPDDFFSLEAKEKEGGMGRFKALTDYASKPKPQSGCNDKFSEKTGYRFGEKE